MLCPANCRLVADASSVAKMSQVFLRGALLFSRVRLLNRRFGA
ncbi:hypothetical protein [Gordonia malaquae]